VSTETKAMQDALQAAVARINNGATEVKQPIAPDMFGMLMTIVPKLLQGSQSSEELVEKLDALQKGDLTSLREQVQILRKQCYRLLKSHERLMTKVEEIQMQQAPMGRAVLDLAHHMSRITFIDDVPGGDDDYEQEPPPVPESYRRAESRVNGNGRARSQRETSAEHGSRGRAGRSK
jgi:hypothetical protein